MAGSSSCPSIILLILRLCLQVEPSHMWSLLTCVLPMPHGLESYLCLRDSFTYKVLPRPICLPSHTLTYILPSHTSTYLILPSHPLTYHTFPSQTLTCYAYLSMISRFYFSFLFSLFKSEKWVNDANASRYNDLVKTLSFTWCMHRMSADSHSFLGHHWMLFWLSQKL